MQFIQLIIGIYSEWSFYKLTVYCCYVKLIVAVNVSKLITIQGNIENTMNCKTTMPPYRAVNFPKLWARQR